MTNDEFVLWVDGFVTLCTEEHMTQRQLDIIENHARLVESIVGYLDVAIKDFLDTVRSRFDINKIISVSEFAGLYLAIRPTYY